MDAAKKEKIIRADFARDIYCVMGMPLDRIDMEGSIDRITKTIIDDTPCFLSTPNLNFFVQSLSDNQFTKSIIESDLSVADGNPVCWLARLLEVPISQRIAGSSMFEELIARSPDSPVKVFFFGGQDDVADQASKIINSKKCGVVCVGSLNPGMGSVDDMSSDSIIENIEKAGADFIVVSLGAKKGQAWILKNKENLSAPVFSHLGAVVNFVAGKIDRAPSLAQSLSLEWLWRIKEEPYLWKRYFLDGSVFLRVLLFTVLPHVWYKKSLARKGLVSQSFRMSISEKADEVTISARGSATRETLLPHRDSLALVAQNDGVQVKLDMDQVTFLDESSLGLLTLFEKHLGSNFSISKASEEAREILRFNRMDHLIKSG